MAYNINQEEYLRMLLTDGRIPMDNNYAEQAIPPFTIARKTFVLMESDNGAKASAMIFSIAETAKANSINTYDYFELLLSEIPKHQDDKDLKFLDNLLPGRGTPQNCPADFKILSSQNVVLIPKSRRNAVFGIKYPLNERLQQS